MWHCVRKVVVHFIYFFKPAIMSSIDTLWYSCDDKVSGVFLRLDIYNFWSFNSIREAMSAVPCNMLSPNDVYLSLPSRSWRGESWKVCLVLETSMIYFWKGLSFLYLQDCLSFSSHLWLVIEVYYLMEWLPHLRSKCTRYH